ncbi:MAG: ATP-binding protein, partial [Balneolales bacterium]|nr:ATP-binding protein [Balneolales bacterium]
VHPEDLPSVEKNLQDTLEGKTETYNTTYRVVHPNGIVKNIDAKGILIKDDIGQNERMIGTCIDITSRIEFEEFQEERAQKLLDVNELLEQEVQRRTEDLTQAIGDLETLTYSISHDLRAPLRAINGFAGIIAEEYQQAVSDTEFDRLLKFIQDNVHKMDERIRSILDYYKMGTGELELQPINLKLIFEEEFDHLSKSYHDLDIDFKVEDLPVIKGDLMLLKQVIQNILDNAIKYSSKKKKSVIRVTFKECDTHYTFYVKDNGTGFDMKYVDKLFMVFQRLHHEKEYKGTGIGLSIAKRIIEMHNGTIKAESKLGDWTAISFTIPKIGS